jgi:hypothetical protein
MRLENAIFFKLYIFRRIPACWNLLQYTNPTKVYKFHQIPTVSSKRLTETRTSSQEQKCTIRSGTKLTDFATDPSEDISGNKLSKFHRWIGGLLRIEQ